MSLTSLVKLCETDLTVYAKVIVKVLEERETVPRVWRLEFQHSVHVDGEQGPEDLGVFDHQVAVPRERLYAPSNIAACQLFSPKASLTLARILFPQYPAIWRAKSYHFSGTKSVKTAR